MQVEGEVRETQLVNLRQGILLQHRQTLGARAHKLQDVAYGPRVPPIRVRQSIPTSWLEISLREGRNRQVRRMTAAVGLPTLRLIRVAIELNDGGPALSLGGLAAGEWRPVDEEERGRLKRLLIQPKTAIKFRAV